MAKIYAKVTPKTQILNDKRWKSALKVAQRKSKSPSKFELQKVSPVDTGFLKQQWEIKPKRLNLNIKNNAPYSGFVNDGTRYIKAQRFTEKALPKILDLYEKNIVREIEKIP